VKQRTEPSRDGWHSGIDTPTKEAIMSDDLHNRGPQDRNRINLHEPWEVQYWTKTLGVTKEELERAVKSAGSSSVDTVRQHLTGKH
jgi:hypothetical protein